MPDPVPAVPVKPGPADIDVEATGSTIGNSEWCGQTTNYTARLLDYGDRPFGGRQSVYRRWRYICPDVTWNLEQYVVDNRPGYVLFSEHADTIIHTIIERIAADSHLPGQASPLRYSDFGIIRTVKHEADGYHVTLDRVVQDVGKLINENPDTYTYVVRDAVLGVNHYKPISLAVGRVLKLTTDGTQVNWVATYRQ